MMFTLSISLIFIFQNVFPIVLQPIKAIFIFVACFGFLLNLNKFSFELKPIFMSIIMASVGLLWSIYGLVLGNPGAVPLMSVMVLYPLLYILLIIYNDSFHFYNVDRIIMLTAWLVTLSQILFLMSFFGIDGQLVFNFMKYLYGDLAIIDSERGMLLFTLPSIGSLLFLFPYVLTKLLFTKGFRFSELLLIMGMVVVIAFSGRRVFYVSVFLSLFVVFIISCYFDILNRFIIRKVFSLFFMGMLSFFLILYLKFDIDYIIDGFYSIIDFKNNDDNLERVHQLGGLFKGIAEYPIFGSGAGAVSDYIRSESQPWAYELFYLSFLFQYGLFGSLVYLSSFLYIIYCKISLLKRGDSEGLPDNVIIVSILSGVISFMIANGTNPYLAKFDYVWVVFLPYICYLRAKRSLN